MKPIHSSASPRPSMSSSLSSAESETRNWLHLPRDITAMILHKVGPIDILNNAQRVCTQWLSISRDPLLWRVIDMTNSTSSPFPSSEEFELKKMCRNAIDRSQGNLVAISISDFGSNALLHYIADSASHLQRLRLVGCYDVSDKGLCEVVKKLPFLEELDLTVGDLSEKSLDAIGRCCPLLKSLKFNMQSYEFGDDSDDEEAFAIAQTMPNLQHLQLYGNRLTNEGLLAILDGCPRLESLDLRECLCVFLCGSLGKRCVEQIKDFVGPNDPSHDYPFDEYDYDEENWSPSPEYFKYYQEFYLDETLDRD